MTDTVLPPSNDAEYRRIVMDCYQQTLVHAVNLCIYINTPKRDRKGRINRYALPFRQEFLRLFEMTKNIKTVTRFTDEIEHIGKWFKIKPEWLNEAKLCKFYDVGISLLERWNRILNEQGIIEFK